MEKLQIALVQNQVGVDGRSRVLGEVVQVINEMGIVPDVYTLASDASIELWRRGWRTMRYRIVRPATVPFVGGNMYQTVLLNWLSRDRLKAYDVVVNSNNFLGFLPTSVRRIHYIHFPLSQVFVETERYRKTHWKLASLPLRLVISQSEGSILPGDITCANSAYSARWIARQWPEAELEVLHPPVEIPDAPERSGARDIDVVTLGAINPDKDQLLQVRIAARLPHHRFVLIGYKASPRYYELVMRSIQEFGLSNVQVITDASRDDIHAHLGRARVLLHTKRDEHFGIGIAEAIGRGCIPVIHDSGGQVEIVPDPRLRYQSEDDAVRILTRLLASSASPDAEVAALREHARQFRPEAFRARFAALLRRAVEADTGNPEPAAGVASGFQGH